MVMAGGGHPAGDDPGAARREEEDQDESDEIFHPLIIVGLVALNRRDRPDNIKGSCSRRCSTRRAGIV